MSYRKESNYKRLGNYIELVDERNVDLEITLLLGLSISKQFIPSVANTIGSNMKNYKIIRKGQFACSIMQVRRDGKMPVALLQDYDEAIISQAYPVFKIVDETLLLPEYLMMWFSRSEFDRQATFHAVGGVRGSLEWDDFLNFELPIPTIEKQNEIVKEYNAIVNRIKLNETLNQKLEEAAQVLYKHWFVDFEFPNENGEPYKSSGGEMVYCEEVDGEVPEGWEMKKMNTLCTVCSSKRIYQHEYVAYGVPFYRSKEVIEKKNGEHIAQLLYISNKRFSKINSKYGSPERNDILLTAVGTLGVSYKVRDEKFYFKDGNLMWFKEFNNVFISSYLYDYMQSSYFNELINNITIGSTQKAITIKTMSDNSILVPIKKVLQNYHEISTIIREKQENIADLNGKLRELVTLLLAKMTKAE